MAKNFPYLTEDSNINIQEAQQNLSKMNSKRLTPKYIIIKFSKDKVKENLESSEKQISYTREIH